MWWKKDSFRVVFFYYFYIFVSDSKLIEERK